MWLTDLETVVTNNAEERYDGVQDPKEGHCRLHVTRALFQEVIEGSIFIIFLSIFLHS